MYQHTKTHAAITNAISKRPALVLVDVAIDPEWQVRGEACVVFQDRGSPYKRPYTLEEIREKLALHGNHEGYASEGGAYRHVYFVADNVPADIREALSA